MDQLKPSLLYLTQVLPYPLDSGAKFRAYYTLRYLAQKYQVTLVSFVRQTDSPAAIKHLETLCEQVVTVPLKRSRRRDGWTLAKSLLTGRSFFIERDIIGAMKTTVADLLHDQHFDFVHADQVSMAEYGLVARAAARSHLPRLILDLHNAFYLIPQRLADTANLLARVWLTEESKRVGRYEASVCKAYDRLVTVTAEDATALSRLFPSSDARPSFKTIPICLDVDSLPPITALTADPKILFVGGLHWPPNAEAVTWFAREVLSRVRAQVPAATFTAIGKNPPPITGEGLLLPGYVEDVSRAWAESRVFVVPLRAGGGMRVKIVEAWARGLPVVSTSIGAEGLEYVDGDNILIADTAEALAKAVYKVLSDNDLAKHLSQRGRETALTTYDWRKAYAAWDEVYG